MDEQEKNQVENSKQVNETPVTHLDDRRRAHGREPWLVGVVLILVGAVFLLQNLAGVYFENWWALFILIPAYGAFSRGWQAVQNAGGQVTAPARSGFIGGLVLTAVAAILFFNLDWIIFGPILLILAGLAMLLNALLPK